MKSPKYFSLGLKLGLVDGVQVQSWVDEQIEINDSPTEAILNLAYIESKNVKQIYSVLLTIPDTRSDFDALRLLLSNVKDTQLTDLEVCKQLAKDLYAICAQNNYECPDDFQEMLFLDEEFCRAMQNANGNIEFAHKSLVEFVESFK